MKEEPVPERGRVCFVCGELIQSNRYTYCGTTCQSRAKRERLGPAYAEADRLLKKKKSDKLRAAGGGVLLTATKSIMVNSAKSRAKKRGIPFNISTDDIHLPDVCPALGIPLVYGGGKGPTDNSPSLDRVLPLLGYVAGNVIVISNRANRIKNNATIPELRAIADFFEKHISTGWMKGKP
jgi:hypothetical protein